MQQTTTVDVDEHDGAMREISIGEIAHVILSRLPWILLATVVAGVAGFFYFRFLPNEYMANTVIYVLEERASTGDVVSYDVSSSAQYAADYAELIKTNEVLDETKQRLGLEDLKMVKIDVKATTGTRVLNISASGTNAVLCRDAVNTVTTVFSEYIERLTDKEMIRIAALAKTPTIPTGPARLRNTALVALVAMMGMAGLFVLLEVLNTRVRTNEDVASVTNLPVLAHVTDYRPDFDRYDLLTTTPGAKNNGARRKQNKKAPLDRSKYLGKTQDGISIFRTVNMLSREAIRTLIANMQFAGLDGNHSTIVVTSSLADEGKTSLSVLMAAALVEEGKRVLVVDLDFRNPSVAKLLRVTKPSNMVGYLQGKHTLDEIIVNDPATGIDMIDNARRSTQFTVLVKSQAFAHMVEEAKSRYDYVFFDTPPIGLFVDSALVAHMTDGALLVVGQDISDRRDMAQSLTQLTKANANILGIALNYVRTKGTNSYYYYSRKRRYGAYGYGHYISKDDMPSS